MEVLNVGLALNGKCDIDLEKFSKEHHVKTWICADGGFRHLFNYKIVPEQIIGDGDSVNEAVTIKYEVEKALTDGELAVAYLNRVYPEANILVVGIVDDNRLEHFVSNLQMLQSNMYLYTKNNVIYKTSETISISNAVEHFSLIDLTNTAVVSITGAKYNLVRKRLTPEINYISNYVVKQEAVITVHEGEVIIFEDYYQEEKC